MFHVKQVFYFWRRPDMPQVTFEEIQCKTALNRVRVPKIRASSPQSHQWTPFTGTTPRW